MKKKIRKNWEPGTNQKIQDAAKRHNVTGKKGVFCRSRKAEALDMIQYLEHLDTAEEIPFTLKIR